MSKVKFRTNVLLKSIIGKDLITDDNIAVLELLKNSFDAGSNNVEIIFRKVVSPLDDESYKKENDSEILIHDSGKGMSQYDLENKWLNIAYSEKKEKREEYGRILAGNKGVGRFSCDRLGKHLAIYTKKRGNSIIKLVIHWEQFEISDDINLNIQDVELDLIEVSQKTFVAETGFPPMRSGTLLWISSLRERWDRGKILSLKRQIERLINPNQSFNASKFDIMLKADEFLDLEKGISYSERVNGPVKNRIFEKLDFKSTSIQSKINSSGKYIITVLQDRGNTIFTLVEKNPFHHLKNIRIHLYYLNPYSKAYFTKQTGMRSFEFGSIFLFINGFRIPPYGDYGDDWLGMESRKGQGRTRYLGTREVIGRIEITDEDDDFKIISNRSGVVHDEIFTQLTKSSSPFGYYYKIFRRLERFVVEGIKWDSVVEKNSFKLEDEVLNDPTWDESRELYTEDSLTRNKRILRVVENIIDSKKDDILRLKINQNFVAELIEVQANKARLDLEFIIDELSNKELSPKELSTFIQRLQITQKEVDSFPANSKSKDLNEVNDDLKNKIEELETLNQILEEKERDRQRLEAELQIEKEKNTYLLASKRTLSDDAKGLIHNVKLTSKRSKQNAQNLYDSIIEDRLKKNIALKWASEIIYNSDKALKISNLITRANFKANSDYQDVNIIKFIVQYFELYNSMYEENELIFTIESIDDEFTKRISILDLSLILDDLISNSVKAGATIVNIMISKIDSSLRILFSDNGCGLASKFQDNEELIFDLGVTTTDGSGIGLNHVRKTLAKMQGTINYSGNHPQLKGASFEILISKSYT
ncbi:ATP-binding protein [uncultured Fluviicola sp.]|uniref:ATP-binding protein n=1 Tax=uncultured Fluviicola sp. TaxID=463303 RepID=UPI0025D713FA|nr:ATP-binding protein [uncultured Fluviicola sp.]